ncbi:MAG: LytR/AlgR family response regulator transcription factor [Oscillospiraceae bacterium]
MIVFFMVNSKPKERRYMEQCAHRLVFELTDENCRYCSYESIIDAERYIESEENVSIAVIDITVENGIDVAKMLRKKFANAFLMLIANASIAPQQYICPSIMAGSLVMRPTTAAQIDLVFEESFGCYFKKFYDESGDSAYILKSKEGRTLIEYSRIICFESREKRIALITDGGEYYFYDTIEKLSEVLPAYFIRCHRSFIVNRSRIKEIKLADGCICMDDGSIVPVSRSYKSALKERLSG